MTDVCRFDFNSACAAVFDRSSAMPAAPMAIGLLIAVRDKTFAKSRRRKFFLDAAECRRRRKDYKSFK
jgi:hypothetical protein